MKQFNTIPASLRVLYTLLIATFLAAGCAKKPAAPEVTAFNTPEEAAAAFVAAVKSDDRDALGKLLGPQYSDVLASGDAVADQADRKWFVAAYDTKHTLDADGADKVTLSVGDNAWPMPIPIVRRGGQWTLDASAGADELVFRRVGRNELGAIDVCRGLVSAQAEYAAEGRDGDAAGVYALKFISDAGMHNGLYWPAAEGEPQSPLGPQAADAAAEGYKKAEGGGRTPYHGYYYRMLYAQGEHANGGARDYFKDGRMTEGFAMIAWPAEYGSSGVQTFIVNQDGVVFQKDLGEDTATAVEAIQAYDPDSSWTAIAPPAEETATPPAG
ncbi:MAG TPA: DUF2950 domain-containing protein [Steroidobacteraceae bacterium]